MEIAKKDIKEQIENMLNSVQKTHYAMSKKGLLFLNSFLEELLP